MPQQSPADNHWMAHGLLFHAGRGPVKKLRALLDAGAHPDAPAVFNAPVDEAAANGQLPALKLLIARGATPTRSVLYRAIHGGHTKVIEFLLKKAFYLTELSVVGDLIDKRLGQYVGPLLDAGIGTPNDHNYKGPLLSSACKAGLGEAAQALLQRGADALTVHEGVHAALWTGAHGDIATLDAFLAAGLPLDHLATEQAMFQALAKDQVAFVEALFIPFRKSGVLWRSVRSMVFDDVATWFGPRAHTVPTHSPLHA